MSSESIPKTQRAAVVTEFKKPYEIKNDHPVTQPSDLKPGQCLVKLEYSGFCHSDVHVKDNDWGAGAKLPLVGGHEGIGKIVAIGEGTYASKVKVGDRVGLKWFANACLRCEMCRTGWETCCGVARTTVHGHLVDGTFQEYAVSYTDYVSPIPEGLDPAEAAPLLCAGLTVYRAIKQSNAKAGQWIAITGAGGGLGHLAVQFAVHKGLRVIAIDTGAEKKELCTKLGAERWVDFKETDNIVQDVMQAADGLGPHAAVIAAAHPQPFNDAVGYLRVTGTLVAVGMPAGGASLNIPIVLLVAKVLNIVGTATGTQQDMEEALQLAKAGKIRCKADVRKLENINEVIDDMMKGNVNGRIVLKI
ncbi:hypothetical protein AAF712_007074 [Marasmius tenuissimus]|uniref:alcohol dehydrogenase n=1 Tax=Marasmius tenuissimus TaxID=585030 RepID=A0ABR2ZXZ8_9AGAR|nr:hypothetical protein PM082_009931 [Marasmius tenuissimus]